MTAGNNWIFFLACAFSLAFACLLFFALYSRTIEPYDDESIPRCTESDKMGGSATLGGDGNIYIVKNNELICVSPNVKDSDFEYDETLPPNTYQLQETTLSTVTPPYCVNSRTQKRKAGDGRLWGIENNMPCVYQPEQ